MMPETKDFIDECDRRAKSLASPQQRAFYVRLSEHLAALDMLAESHLRMAASATAKAAGTPTVPSPE